MTRPQITPEWMDWALRWTPEDQAAAESETHYGCPTAVSRAARAEWPWVQLAQRLAFHHGRDGALRRMGWREAA